ncbi:cysteine desulfurase [soil metagenome]
MNLPIYLDYAATTPIDPTVIAAMVENLNYYGNPSSVTHAIGRQASACVEQARQHMADAIQAQTSEVIWTSGATEANNLAIKGTAWFYQHKGRHIITSKIEHKAVLGSCEYLAQFGFEVTYLPTNQSGLIDLQQLQAALRADTILVSIMHVNNEIGVIQDIAAIGTLCRDYGVSLHVDAAQSLGKLPIDMSQLQVDLMSFSAHKIYGPKGVGALYVRRKPRARLVPLLHGGSQEQGLRGGTLATHQIVGMGLAAHIAQKKMQEESLRIKNLRDKLFAGITALGDIQVNTDVANSVAGILNISVLGVEGEALLPSLKNIALSAGSACNSASIDSSHVLRAIGLSDQLAHNSLRLSLGRFTTEEEIDYVVSYFNQVIKELRR